MSKRKPEVLPARKDGKRRTKRQKQTLVNNRNFQARKFYDEKRPELIALVAELKKEKNSLYADNVALAGLYYPLVEKHEKAIVELKALKAGK